MTRTLGSEFPGLHNPDLETKCYNPELGPSSGLYNPELGPSSGLYTRFVYKVCNAPYHESCFYATSSTSTMNVDDGVGPCCRE